MGYPINNSFNKPRFQNLKICCFIFLIEMRIFAEHNARKHEKT